MESICTFLNVINGSINQVFNQNQKRKLLKYLKSTQKVN